MSNSDLLDSLFSRCLGRDESGQVPTPEVVCRDHAELLPEVLLRLQVVRRMEDLVEPNPSTRTHLPETRPLAESRAGGASERRIGRYELVERIGEGGMGEVWVAQQSEPMRRRVAVKLIRGGADFAQVVTRFEQERQALALMDHPNIARVFDGGQSDRGQPYFVMELVVGKPITEYCESHGLPPAARLELFVAVCSAVQHAHQKGIVHRDLKPSNILVTRVDGQAVPKVIDFGVAKALFGKLTDQTLATNLGSVIGTLEYMAPEQAGTTLEDVDTRADIYSLGVILYELLTGLRPFDSDRLRVAPYHEVVRILCEEDPPKPSTRLAGRERPDTPGRGRPGEVRKRTAALRGELDWIVMKCLEKDRSRRYETASALSQDVQRYLADEPIEARPPSFSYRTGKLIRKNRGLVIGASVVAATLVAGLVISTSGLLRARAAEQTASRDRDRAEEANRVARQKSDEATGLVDDWFLAVSDDPEMKELPQTSTVRARLLRRAEMYYSRLAEHDDESPEGARKRFRAARNLAVIAAETKQPNDSELFRRALELLNNAVWPADPAEKHFETAKLLKMLALSSEYEKKPIERVELLRQAESRLLLAKKEHPTNVDIDVYHIDLVRGIGSHLFQGPSRAEAETETDRAIDLAIQAVRRHPDHPEVGIAKLSCLKVFCDHAWLANKPDSAFRHLDELIQMANRFMEVKDAPNSVVDLGSDAWTSAAIVRDLTGRPDLAGDLFIRARLAKQQLFFRSPGTKRYTQSLAIHCHNASVFFRKQKNYQQAEQEALEGIRTFRFLLSSYSHLQQTHYDLYGAIRNHAQILLEAGDPAKALQVVSEAETVYKQFLARFPTPTVTGLSRAALIFEVKGQAHAEQGKFAQALAAFDEAPRVSNPGGLGPAYQAAWAKWLKSSAVTDVRTLSAEAAVARAEALLTREPPNAYEWWLAIVCFQQAVDRQRKEPGTPAKGVPPIPVLQDRAASILEGMRALPSFPAAERIPMFLESPELRPLAELPRVRKLLGELASKR